MSLRITVLLEIGKKEAITLSDVCGVVGICYFCSQLTEKMLVHFGKFLSFNSNINSHILCMNQYNRVSIGWNILHIMRFETTLHVCVKP